MKTSRTRPDCLKLHAISAGVHSTADQDNSVADLALSPPVTRETDADTHEYREVSTGGELRPSLTVGETDS